MSGASPRVTCRACAVARDVAEYTPSRLRKHDLICRACVNARYRVAPSARLSAAARVYKAIARIVPARERKRGVALPPTSAYLSGERVRTLVEHRYRQRSALTLERVPLAAMALDRADVTRPFDVHNNCALFARVELRRRARLAAFAATSAPHAALVAAMTATIATNLATMRTERRALRTLPPVAAAATTTSP
jgi:hypothetical protein